MKNEKNKAESSFKMKELDALADLMDNKFHIPGTGFRFGLDSIIGLIPYVGDLAGFAVSSYLLSVMARNGASVWIMLRMIGNTLVDTLVGAIPFFGDLFDIGFKSNRRNVDMLKRYYADGKRKPSAKRSAFVVLFLFIALFVSFLVLLWQVLDLLFTWAWASISAL